MRIDVIIVVINNIVLCTTCVLLFVCANLFTCSVTAQPPTNVSATVLTPRSVEVTWTVSSSSDITGYLISYTTTAEYYTSCGSVIVSGSSATRGTLMNLEESTLYTITVQATASNDRMSGNSNAVSLTTYTDGK